MAEVTIAPEVELAELRAEIEWRRQRALLLHQALLESETGKAAIGQEKEAIEMRLAELETPAPAAEHGEG